MEGKGEAVRFNWVFGSFLFDTRQRYGVCLILVTTQEVQ